jgi:cation diffusion facilitator family transporter
VIVAVALVGLTGWLWLDPIIALLVAINILWTGWSLMQRSAAGMMDAALPADDLNKILSVLNSYQKHGIQYHALRTRQAGSRAFINVHLLAPGEWSIQQGHDWSERIESEIRLILNNVHISTHMEPIEDPLSMADQDLDRL